MDLQPKKKAMAMLLLRYKKKKKREQCCYHHHLLYSKTKNKKKGDINGREGAYLQSSCSRSHISALDFVGQLQAHCSCYIFKRVGYTLVPTPIALAME
jgi:hypothetical protein